MGNGGGGTLQKGLRYSVSLRCGLAEPVDGLPLVTADALALLVAQRQLLANVLSTR
jgi:hypothetical protein